MAGEFAKAFVKAQKEVKAATKESANEGFKRGNKVSRYADLTSVWEACREALAANGFGVMQPTNFDATDFWIETVLLHESGEEKTGRYPIRPVASTPQSVGSAITYARRYALSAMLGIVTEEDDDGNAASEGKPAINGNGHLEDKVTSRKSESENVRAAREWTNEQMSLLLKMKTMDNFEVWLDRWAKDIQRLEKLVPDEHAALTKAMTRAQMRLNPQTATA